MLRTRFASLATLAFLALAAAVPSVVRAAGSPAVPLIDMSKDGAEARFTPDPGSEAQVQVAKSSDASSPGIVVTYLPGPKGYPGVVLKPAGGVESWDLSAYGHIDARVTNTSTTRAMLAMRVDNDPQSGDGPWNTESVRLAPGASGTISVIFGYAYGYQPGYPLKSNAITRVLLFTSSPKAAVSFRIDSIAAGGPAGEKPPVVPIDPASIRTKPKDDVIVGTGVVVDAASQVAASGAQASVAGGIVNAVFPAAVASQWVRIKPPVGKWDLTDASEVRVRLKNTGSTPVTPTVQVTSGESGTDAITAPSPMAPGTETVIEVPFAPAAIWKGGSTGGGDSSVHAEPGTGTNFASDAVDGIKISAQHDGAASLAVEWVVADAPAAVLPDWLGKKPPVDGEWVQTFNDEFRGKTIDQTRWNIYGPNFWDKQTHWSKDDLILPGHGVTLHFEKKTGFQNDDPTGKQTDYACGYLDSFGKWVQRYGYFEARVKLPTAPGLWPTFWLMPDRGAAAGPQWKREDTHDGGMEFDIMEHLDRWGDHRYNIAMHWDGYGKEHKATGSQFNYVQHDKDGYITVGLLWTPGFAIYYCNGKEVLRYEDPRVSTVPSHFIIEETTGGWDNNRVDYTKLPSDYTVDYVRVWQRKDLASAVDSAPSIAP